MLILTLRTIDGHGRHRCWKTSLKPIVRYSPVSYWYFKCLFTLTKSLEQYSISSIISFALFVSSTGGYRCFILYVPLCISLLVVWWSFHQLYIESFIYWRSSWNPWAIDRWKRLDELFLTGCSITTHPMELVTHSKLEHIILYVVFEHDGERIQIRSTIRMCITMLWTTITIGFKPQKTSDAFIVISTGSIVIQKILMSNIVFFLRSQYDDVVCCTDDTTSVLNLKSWCHSKGLPLGRLFFYHTHTIDR